MKKVLTIGNYTFTNTDGQISYVNNETGATGQPNTAGNVTIMVDGNKTKYTTNDLLAMEGWQDAPAETSTETNTETAPAQPVAPAKSMDELNADVASAQSALDAATTDEQKTIATAALEAAKTALKDAQSAAELEAIKESIAATRKRNETALKPLQDAVDAAKSAWTAAAASDADFDQLMKLRDELKAANDALAAFTPEVDESESKITERIADIDNQMEDLQSERKELKKMLTAAVGRTISDRKEFPDFTWEMGEQCRTLKNEGKTGTEIQEIVNCSYGSYQRAIGKKSDGFKPEHPVYKNKPTQVQIKAD